MHGWDLAVATGQRYPGDDLALAGPLTTAYDWARAVAEQNPGGTPGLFGPPVEVTAEAAVMDRLLGLTGCQPGWQPG